MFGIKLIILRSKLNVATFWICMDAWVIFNNFFLIDATDGSKISSDQKRLFFAGSGYPLSFFANTLFNLNSKFLSLAVYKSLNTKMCTFLKQHLYPLLVQWLKKTFFFSKNILPENKVIIANVTTIKQADINNLDNYHRAFQISNLGLFGNLKYTVRSINLCYKTVRL